MYIQPNEIKKIAAELDSMLYDFITKGGVIAPINRVTFKYRNYLIVYNEQQNIWNVFYLTNIKIHIASTCLKVSAFAICKLHEKGLATQIKEIKKYDDVFLKNYIDSLFFKHTISCTSDELKKNTALCRFELVQAKAKHAKKKIDNLFYSSLA